MEQLKHPMPSVHHQRRHRKGEQEAGIHQPGAVAKWASCSTGEMPRKNVPRRNRHLLKTERTDAHPHELPSTERRKDLAIGTGSDAHKEIEPANAKGEKRDKSGSQTQSRGLEGETRAGTPASTQCGLSFRSETKIARPAELSIWARYFAFSALALNTSGRSRRAPYRQGRIAGCAENIRLPMARVLGTFGLAGTVNGFVLIHTVYALAFTTLFFRNVGATPLNRSAPRWRLVDATTAEQKIICAKVGLRELARQLGNVS